MASTGTHKHTLHTIKKNTHATLFLLTTKLKANGGGEERKVERRQGGERAKERSQRRNCTGDGDSESSPHLVT